jgi:hypothetical protein
MMIAQLRQYRKGSERGLIGIRAIEDDCRPDLIRAAKDGDELSSKVDVNP